METHEWQQLDSPDSCVASRSGHTACVYNHQMVVFAGIHEITKELDDMATYNFKEHKWTHLFKACQEKSIGVKDSKFSQSSKLGGSPARTSYMGNTASPLKISKGHTLGQNST